MNVNSALCYSEFAQKYLGVRLETFDIWITSVTGMAAPVFEFLDGFRSSSEGVTFQQDELPFWYSLKERPRVRNIGNQTLICIGLVFINVYLLEQSVFCIIIGLAL